MEKIAGNLIFIGMMGAGKTTLGKQIAQILNRPFYDSDHEICKHTGVNIPTIFEMEGEQGFRNRETAMLDKLTGNSNIVLATGGGAVVREENRGLLRERGTVIYLHSIPEVLLERTRYDTNRPLLQVADPLAKLQELYNARDSLYRSTAHITVESGHSRETVENLLKKLSPNK